MTIEVVSPHGGPTGARQSLTKRFASRLKTGQFYSRKLVSYQGNRTAPGFRWLKYKEGFSSQLVTDLIEREDPQAVLDPFSGICTTPLNAAGRSRQATGIEIMPVGISLGSAIAAAANGLSASDFNKQAAILLQEVRSRNPAPEFAFQHVRITAGAFSSESEQEIARARGVVATLSNPALRSVLDVACMSALEEASYTRKDGQYLRWDHRAERSLRASVDLGFIPRFSEALERRLGQIAADLEPLKQQFGGGLPNLITGSCLELLKDIPAGEYDLVITSPPYANRYDYTRTYALELAWLGFDQAGFSALRQQMLSATVENKTKADLLAKHYGGRRDTLDRAMRLYDSQDALHEVLHILEDRKAELSNRSVLKLIEHYFFEMAVVISELGRIVRPAGVVYMVNDNVQYHGEELPVDFILSDFAEGAGFKCDRIWKLARGKGNSSQQMARFGRRELRKCVYRWVRSHD